jgi:branched-chain amino acid transport system ATP-binding protein
VRSLSLEVKKGELVSLIGANGAGKTTTLRAISGDRPGRRRAHRIRRRGHHARKPARGAGNGHRALPGGPPRLSVHVGAREPRDGLLSCAATEPASRATSSGSSSAFPVLAERREQAAGTLSGGEQQMLAISRALMSRPKLVLFDEPSLGLAPEHRRADVRDHPGIRADGVTVVMVEQNAAAALELSDRAYVMEQGAVALTGTGASLLHDPHVQRAYLGG